LIEEHVDMGATRIVFTVTDRRIDGLIILGDEQKKRRGELTVAMDRKNSPLQMELLKNKGTLRISKE
jgi:hypothetical protein